MTLSIQIDPDATTAHYLTQYQGQTSPQPVHLYLDGTDKQIYVKTWHEIGDGCFSSTHNSLDLRWTLIATPTAVGARELCELVLPIAEQLVALYSECYDGSNYVGSWGDDAGEALYEQIAHTLREAGDCWLNPVTAGELFEHLSYAEIAELDAATEADNAADDNYYITVEDIADAIAAARESLAVSAE